MSSEKGRSQMSGSFQGREKELQQLQRLFGEVAEGKGPKMAVILAHTGVGKTRLAQEFYRWLAASSQWNENRFWPEDLGEVGLSLRVNPDLQPRASVKPKFAWWGVRANSTLDRNSSGASCLLEHAHALRHMRRLVTSILTIKDFGRALLDVGKDIGIPPGGGAILELAGKLREGMRQKQLGSGEAAREEREQVAEELLDHVESILTAGSGLPTVLLLDDMQWVDDEALLLLCDLWTVATKRSMPLFIIATHWETDWLVAAKGPADGHPTFARLAKSAGAETLKLENSPESDMRSWAREALPGLTPDQLDLLVEKAGLNFLQMVQNVAALRIKAATCFEGGTVSGGLSPSGKRYLAGIHTEPERRAAQRFQELEEPVQLVLGWASQLGMRFLHDVVVELASSRSKCTAGASALNEAVDPQALLARASEHLSEFRQGVFHDEARRQFNVYGLAREEVEQALREALVTEALKYPDTGGEQADWLLDRLSVVPLGRAAVAVGAPQRAQLLQFLLRGDVQRGYLTRAGERLAELRRLDADAELGMGGWKKVLQENLKSESQLELARCLLELERPESVEDAHGLLCALDEAQPSAPLPANLDTKLLLAEACARRAEIGSRSVDPEALVDQAHELLDEAENALEHADGSLDEELLKVRILTVRGRIGQRTSRVFGGHGSSPEDCEPEDLDRAPDRCFEQALNVLRRVEPCGIDVLELRAGLNELLADAYRADRKIGKGLPNLEQAVELRSQVDEARKSVRSALSLAKALRRLADCQQYLRRREHSQANRERVERLMPRFEGIAESETQELKAWLEGFVAHHG